MRDPQSSPEVSILNNAHDLDDLDDWGYPHDFGNLHYPLVN